MSNKNIGECPKCEKQNPTPPCPNCGNKSLSYIPTGFFGLSDGYLRCSKCGDSAYSIPCQFCPCRIPAWKWANYGCFIATEIYGLDAPETNTLRRWRDERLLRSGAGRVLVAVYCCLSSRLVPLLRRVPWLRREIRRGLDRLVRMKLTRPGR